MRLAAAMKRQPLAWRYRLLLALLAGLAAAAASHGRWLGTVDEAIFDHYVARWSYPADPSLLIVAIDEASLQQIGPWPWSRSVHARLLDRLTRAGSKRVLLDLPLSEPDRHPGADAALAAAIARNGQVVLPVLAVPARDGRLAEERLPIALMTANAAALGHAEVHVDADGVARGIFLQAGIGSAHWPALGLALADLPERAQGLPAAEVHAGADKWVRDGYVRLRYTGPPGSVPQVAYVDVLEGRIAPASLHNRRVLVGSTAAGLAPQLLAPTRRHAPMSGIEYHASVASMLLQSRTLRGMPPMWQHALGAMLVMLCVAGLCGGRAATILAISVGLPLPLLLSWSLLRGANLWWAPCATLGTALLAIAIWAAWRIASWRRRADRDPLSGLVSRPRFEQALQQETCTGSGECRPLALVRVELDHAGGLDDQPGPQAGDALQVAVARLIAAHARRPRDTAGHLGGGFAMILPETPPSGACQVVEDLIADVRRLPWAADAGNVRPTLSIGVYCRVPGPGVPADAFLHGAEVALRQARANGGDGYVLEAG